MFNISAETKLIVANTTRMAGQNAAAPPGSLGGDQTTPSYSHKTTKSLTESCEFRNFADIALITAGTWLVFRRYPIKSNWAPLVGITLAAGWGFGIYGYMQCKSLEAKYKPTDR
uniref:Uncharacterized protein n=1 Tax=Plectus sambesii TaxID=2011161 RepID=A0A914VD04_9BILA